MRLRDVLRRVMGVSYTAMKSAKWDGGITVDGVVTPVDAFVRAGQVVAIRFRENAPVYAVKPYDLPLNIACEDDWLFVIDKPAPLASQSSALHPDDTLENALYAHLRCPTDFVYRPVNRLDKGTSGLLCVARHAHAQRLLTAQLHSDAFLREYLAITDGIPKNESGVIDAPIARLGTGAKRGVVSGGQRAVTHYRVEQIHNGRALIRLKLETGRTHQIRVHLSYMGCPILGDYLYGNELPELKDRFALHSAHLRCVQPVTGQMIDIVEPLPRELQILMENE